VPAIDSFCSLVAVDCILKSTNKVSPFYAQSLMMLFLGPILIVGAAVAMVPIALYIRRGNPKW
jgi:hypothetical protein